MSLLAKLTRRSGLVNRMADTVGVDMAEELLHGTVTAEDLRSAVFRCMSCSKNEECQHWMDLQEAPAKAAPGYCRNKDMLARVAHG